MSQKQPFIVHLGLNVELSLEKSNMIGYLCDKYLEEPIKNKLL